MALSFDHPDAPGAGPHYIFIEQAYPNRNTGAISWRAAIYAGEQARKRLLAADAALIGIHQQVVAIERSTLQARQEFNSEVAKFKTEEEKRPLRDASAKFAMEQEAAKDLLKAQQVEQTSIFNANKPRVHEAGSIPAGVLTVREDGTVPLGDVYTWLAANKYPGAMRAD